MEIVTDPKVFQEICLSYLRRGTTTALVPTMGFFHQGHISLMEQARNSAEKVMVSIFVNPAQFGPGEDLEAYPRDFERDCRMARNAGVDLIFAPKPSLVYHEDHATWIEVQDLAKGLCGRSRPGHFRGVVTVVAKLLTLSLPTMALFGEKDWQQLAVIRRMARDLDFPVEIVGCPIVREDDGLAKSSRNSYLSQDERAQAPFIYQGLLKARSWVRQGQTDARTLADKLETYFSAHVPGGRVDYIEMVHPETLAPVDEVSGPTLAAVAVYLGRARLIDNMLLQA